MESNNFVSRRYLSSYEVARAVGMVTTKIPYATEFPSKDRHYDLELKRLKQTMPMIGVHHKYGNAKSFTNMYTPPTLTSEIFENNSETLFSELEINYCREEEKPDEEEEGEKEEEKEEVDEMEDDGFQDAKRRILKCPQCRKLNMSEEVIDMLAAARLEGCKVHKELPHLTYGVPLLAMDVIDYSQKHDIRAVRPTRFSRFSNVLQVVFGKNKKTVWDYQRLAICRVCKSASMDEGGVVIMPCGTGKTITFLTSAVAIGAPAVIIQQHSGILFQNLNKFFEYFVPRTYYDAREIGIIGNQKDYSNWLKTDDGINPSLKEAVRFESHGLKDCKILFVSAERYNKLRKISSGMEVPSKEDSVDSVGYCRGVRNDVIGMRPIGIVDEAQDVNHEKEDDAHSMENTIEDLCYVTVYGFTQNHEKKSQGGSSRFLEIVKKRQPNVPYKNLIVSKMYYFSVGQSNLTAWVHPCDVVIPPSSREILDGYLSSASTQRANQWEWQITGIYPGKVMAVVACISRARATGRNCLIFSENTNVAGFYAELFSEAGATNVENVDGSYTGDKNALIRNMNENGRGTAENPPYIISATRTFQQAWDTKQVSCIVMAQVKSDSAQAIAQQIGRGNRMKDVYNKTTESYNKDHTLGTLIMIPYFYKNEFIFKTTKDTSSTQQPERHWTKYAMINLNNAYDSTENKQKDKDCPPYESRRTDREYGPKCMCPGCDEYGEYETRPQNFGKGPSYGFENIPPYSPYCGKHGGVIGIDYDLPRIDVLHEHEEDAYGEKHLLTSADTVVRKYTVHSKESYAREHGTQIPAASPNVTETYLEISRMTPVPEEDEVDGITTENDLLRVLITELRMVDYIIETPAEEFPRTPKEWEMLMVKSLNLSEQQQKIALMMMMVAKGWKPADVGLLQPLLVDHYVSAADVANPLRYRQCISTGVEALKIINRRLRDATYFTKKFMTRESKD